MRKHLLVLAAFVLPAVGAFTRTAHAQMLAISEIYGGGNNSGASYQNDFIEIFNRGATSISLGGYSLQYNPAASADGNAWSVTPLTAVTLAPGAYYLVKESGGTANGVPLPASNTTGTINLAANAGKVALLSTTTALTSANPSGNTALVDFVGYGTNGTPANAFEGAGQAPGGSNNATSIQRANGGATDTNNNNLDFALGTPNPVPEPSTWAMALGGLGVLVLLQRRHRRRLLA